MAGRSVAGAGRGSVRLAVVQPGQGQPAGLGRVGDLLAGVLLCETLAPPAQPPMTSGLSVDMTATGGVPGRSPRLHT